ncbi:LAMI_0H14356g1_1 [Lachancea mirantina]|uniref:MICOS complex subunit MIC60 n=1 Tax=Lachancea mirantina TaxID=1230905 RepID=A0A1G4KIC6_9SACH|nr:LAMI_0H14356g1_1 [Lachancea mirantina]
MLTGRALRLTARRAFATLPEKPASKSHPVRKFVSRVVLATTAFYAGGVALSLYNDQFEELFTESVPGAERLIEWSELLKNGSFRASQVSLDELKQKFGAFTTKVDRIPNHGADPTVTTLHEAQTAAPQPTEPVEEVAMVKLTLHPIPGRFEPTSKAHELVSSVNELVDNVNGQSILVSEDAYDAVQKTYIQLGDAVQVLAGDFDKALAEALAVKYGQATEDLQASYETRFKERELDLTGDFLQQFNSFKKQLEEHSSEELKAALKANEQALLAKQANEVAFLSIKQVEEFNKILSEKLDKERQGRLAHLEDLDKDVNSLGDVIDAVDRFVVRDEVITQLTLVLAQIQNTLQSKDLRSVQIQNEIERLKTLTDTLPKKNCCSQTPRLLDVLVNELSELTENRNLLSREQIYNRWILLQKDIATATLLPPNAGILGHISAKFFSLFLFNKSGSPVNNDVDSVIARVTEDLRLAKLDKAVEEVVALQGWPRVLSEQWLQDARTKLEVEILVEALDCTVRTL